MAIIQAVHAVCVFTRLEQMRATSILLHHWICHTRKTHATLKPDGSIFYRIRVMGGNRHFGRFRLL